MTLELNGSAPRYTAASWANKAASSNGRTSISEYRRHQPDPKPIFPVSSDVPRLSEAAQHQWRFPP